MAIIPYVNDYSKDVNELGQRPEFVGVTENPGNGSIAIPVVYGARRVEGIRMWTQVSATNQAIMYCAYALSEGWCNGVTQLFIDDKKVALTPSDFQHRIPKAVTSGTFAGVLEVEFVDGRDADARGYNGNVVDVGASTLLQRDFAQTFYWDRVAYIVCKFTYVANGAYTQFPKVSVDMEGRKVPNWNFPSSPPYVNVPAYSTNPVAIIWDLMSNPVYGRGISKEEIDIDSFDYVRDKCNLIRPNLTVSQPIYSCNWICNTETSVLSNINIVLETFQLNLSYIQTKWVLTAEHAPGALPTSNPNFKFTEDNIIGNIQIQYPNISERYNRVIVEHVEPTSNYQTSSTQFPVTDSSIYLTEDNNIALVKRIQTNLITNRIVANDIAQMTLLRSRNQVTYRFTATKDAYQLRIGDFCYIQTTLPLIGQQAVVISMVMNADNTIDMECISYNAAWYPNAFTNTVTAPNSSLVIPTTPSPTQTWTVTSNRDNGATGNTVLEGESITWTITTTGISNGTVFNWTIAGLSGNDLATSYTFVGNGTISSNTATVTTSTRYPNTINGDRIFTFSIGPVTNPLAKWQGVLKDNGVTTPTNSYTYTFNNAKALDDNPAWYLGWTTPTDSQVFYWAKTSSGNGNTLSSQLGHFSNIVLNANGCLTLDTKIGLIDRRSDQQGFTKNIYAVWSGNAAAAVPTALGYRKQGSTTGVYGRETYVYNPQNPPYSVSPQLSKLTPNVHRTVNDEIIYAGTSGTAYTGAIPVTPVAGKTGQYEMSLPIRHLLYLNFNSISSTFWPMVNGNPAYFYHDDINSSTLSVQYTVAFFQHSPTNNVFTYIGKTLITVGTNSMTRNNDPQLALSSWLNDSRGQWINKFGTTPSAPPF